MSNKNIVPDQKVKLRKRKLPSGILRAEFGVERLSVTGGGNINAAFLKEGLLDEVSIMWCPGIDGRSGMTTAFDGLQQDFPPTKLKLISVEKLGETIWARYKL